MGVNEIPFLGCMGNRDLARSDRMLSRSYGVAFLIMAMLLAMNGPATRFQGPTTCSPPVAGLAQR